MMIAYVLPTHNRPAALARTLDALANLPPHDAEVIIVDNASSPPPHTPVVLANGLHVTLVMRAANEGAAARNAGVRAGHAHGEWIVMLDDDSAPLNLDFLQALREQPQDVAAVAAEILLRDMGVPPMVSRTNTKPASDMEGSVLRRESGGLPEVFIGCGVAIRRADFLEAGGYDESFHYYAEEYDLAARLMLMGKRIVLDRRFRVLHEKTQANRSMDTILRRLVRNNAWIMQRFAPDSGNTRRAELRRTLSRYGRIALKERAEIGYALGLFDLARTHLTQPRTPMPAKLWDRFTGKAACRRALLSAWADKPFATVALVARGKNDHVVREALEELGVEVIPDAESRRADALVIATLSPGPMLDALDALADSPQRIIAPWAGIGDHRSAAKSAHIAAAA